MTQCEILQGLLDDAIAAGNEALALALRNAMMHAGCGVTSQGGGNGNGPPVEGGGNG